MSDKNPQSPVILELNDDMRAEHPAAEPYELKMKHDTEETRAESRKHKLKRKLKERFKDSDSDDQEKHEDKDHTNKTSKDENKRNAIKEENKKKKKIQDFIYDRYDLEPENTIIAIDLHHVLFRPSKKKICKTILKHPEKTHLLRATKADGFAGFVIDRITGEDDRVPEHSMKELIAKSEGKHRDRYHNYLNPLITELCNSQNPDIDTFLLLEKLKMAGYSVYLLSNIGTDYFENLRKQFHEDLFKHFDGFYTTNEEDAYVRKPDVKIFENFKKKFNPENSKRIIFIDDSLENVQGSYSADMIGVQYTNAKQLEETLHNIGMKF